MEKMQKFRKIYIKAINKTCFKAYMTDVLTKKQRSYCMSQIKSNKTLPELKLKPLLNALGFTYQPKNIYGKPDFANKKEKIVIFMDGCFWHKCPKCFKKPKTNAQFWDEKMEKNKLRDQMVTLKLKKEGWKVIRVWEHILRQIS